MLERDGGSVILRYDPTGLDEYDEVEYDIKLAAFDSSGDPVTSYGSNGTASLPPDFIPTDASMARDGSVTLSGYSTLDDETTFLQAMRFTPSGEPDPEFGSDGRVVLSRAGFTGDAAGVVTGRGGGAFFSLGISPGSTSAVAKLTSDGRLSPSFGNDGVTDEVPGLSEFRLAFGPEKKLMIDVHDYFKTENSYVYRYRDDGSVDKSYARNGIATFKDPRVHGERGDEAFLVDNEGRSLIAQTYGYGDYRTEKLRSTIGRLKRNGRPDPNFDASQAFEVNHATQRAFRVSDMAIDKKGRIVLSGGRYEGYPHEDHSLPTLARLHTDGSLDRTFGSGGFATFQPRDLGTTDLRSVGIQRDGKILATGGGATFRFLSSSHGPSDRDADGFENEDDRCPSVPNAAPKSRGCPKVPVKLTGRYVRLDGIDGDIAAPRRCLVAHRPDGHNRGTPIRIMRVRRGPDKPVSSVRVELRYAAWEWPGAKKHPGGRFYAEYGPIVRPKLGRCERTRTRTIVVPGNVGG